MTEKPELDPIERCALAIEVSYDRGDTPRQEAITVLETFRDFLIEDAESAHPIPAMDGANQITWMINRHRRESDVGPARRTERRS